VLRVAFFVGRVPGKVRSRESGGPENAILQNEANFGLFLLNPVIYSYNFPFYSPAAQ
jgi:hypothetical protein